MGSDISVKMVRAGNVRNSDFDKIRARSLRGRLSRISFSMPPLPPSVAPGEAGILTPRLCTLSAILCPSKDCKLSDRKEPQKRGCGDIPWDQYTVLLFNCGC